MERIFHIGEISRFFQIPASTLRYWEETGILSPRKGAWNNYREYTVADLMTISDILFYKNLGLSLKQIHTMESIAPMEHRDLLSKKIQEIELHKQELNRRIQRLRIHLFAIETLQKLKDTPFIEGDIDTEYIIPFEFIEIDKLRQYIENPYLYSRVQHSSHPDEEQRGLTITARQAGSLPDKHILWKKQSHRYIICLMKEEITETFPNNLSSLLAHVQSTYQTGYIISRFLLCAKEDDRLFDFYKTYIEIL